MYNSALGAEVMTKWQKLIAGTSKRGEAARRHGGGTGTAHRGHPSLHRVAPRCGHCCSLHCGPLRPAALLRRQRHTAVWRPRRRWAPLTAPDTYKYTYSDYLLNIPTISLFMIIIFLFSVLFSICILFNISWGPGWGWVLKRGLGTGMQDWDRKVHML